MKLFAGRSKTAAAMMAAIAVICLFFLVAGLIVTLFIFPFEKPLPYALGLAAGCILSLLKVVLLDKTIDRAVDMEGKQAENYTKLQAVSRFGLTILLVLGVVFLRDYIGLFGAILGILSLQLGAYAANLILKRQESRGSAVE